MIPDQTLQELTRRLVDQFHPAAVILFGSQARGTADDRSDVDILVIRRIEAPEDRREIINAMHRAMSGMKIGTDIVLMTPEEFDNDRDIPGQVARYADLDGRVLYQRAA